MNVLTKVGQSPETPQQAASRLASDAVRNGFQLLTLHEYADANGKPLYYRIRAKHRDGRKWIRPMHLADTGFVLREPEFPGGKPLYRLHDLVARPDEMVIIVEGESCADTVMRLGLLATTSGSADSANEADWQPLAGRTVLIWPDNDPHGQRYADSVLKKLRTQGCAVQVINVAMLNLPHKGDIIDWLHEHPNATAEDILALPIIEPTKLNLIYPQAYAGAPVCGTSSHDWPEPRPIQAPLHPVPDFETETLLPDPLRGWVIDEAERMSGHPVFIAAAAIVALGAIIGTRCVIRPKSLDSWVIIPNLWGANVGSPATKKTPAITAGLKPLNRQAAKAKELYKTNLQAYEAEKIVYAAKMEAIQADIKKVVKNNGCDLDKFVEQLQWQQQQTPAEPILRRYKTNDSTVAKLGELLRDNPAGLLLERDELVGLLASWDSEGHEGERAFFLEAWNGSSSFDIDRIGRGSIDIENLCVSIFGGIQPDKLIGYLEHASRGLANDGMLQRFQVLVYPDEQQWRWLNRAPEKEAQDTAYGVFDALSHFDPVAWGAAPADSVIKFPSFCFDAAAQEIFVEWSCDLHRNRLPKEDQPLIQQHLAKYDKLFPALALIFHLVDCAATGQRGAVTKKAALYAAAWCEFLEAHARRCYGLLIDDGLRSAQELADKIKQNKLTNSFTARDVRRFQWRYLTDDRMVGAAIDWLEDAGWLKSEVSGGTGPGGGRRTIKYMINPQCRNSCKKEVRRG
jgi:5S rRNA maturation endonuclease (ribonuclease M5)